MMHNQFVTDAAMLIGSNAALATVIAVASLVCLLIAIVMVNGKKSASDKRIASALAHAIRQDVV
jgi:hypothetical protein